MRPEGNHKTWGHFLHQGNQTWVGLDPQTLQTPYLELKEVCELLSPEAQQSIIDLGAGYGRMGLVLNALCPEVKFVGYEFVAERVNEGRRIFAQHELNHAELYVQDLTDKHFVLPVADYYFLYDYGELAHIRRTLKQLEDLADRHSFKVVARGKGARSLIEYEHPWLSDVYTPIHRENFSIYSMAADN